MPYAPEPRPARSHLLPRAYRAPLLWLALLALGIYALVGAEKVSQAAPDHGIDIVYLSVTSEGSTAKAWYDGGPSPGVPVQEALTKFAHEGYEVAGLSQDLRTTEEGVVHVILLQRRR